MPKPRLRCSSLDQIINCPASFTLIPLVVDTDEDSEASTQGNWCHAQAARRLIEEHGATTPTLIKFPKHYEPDSIDNWVVDFYLEEFLDQVPGDWAIEVENELAYDYGRFILTGHQDALAVSPDIETAVAVDLKRGRVPVDEAGANWQILGYLVQVKRAYPSLKKIIYSIIQPLAMPDLGYERVSTVMLEGDRLEQAVPFLTGKLEEALDNPSLLQTGWKYCRYCPVANTFQCPAVNAHVQEMKLTLTKDHIAAIQQQPDLQQLGEWTVDRRMLAGLMDKAAKLLKEQIGNEPLILERDGSRIILADRNGQRRIESEPGWQKLVEIFPSEECYECIRLSPTEIEKQLAAFFKIPKTSKKNVSGQSEFKRIFGSITHQDPTTELIIS